VFMRGSDLCMQCGSQTRVGVQLFGLDGRVLASKPAVLLGPGTHVVAGGLFFREIRSFACGILVVTAGDHRYNLRVTLVGGGILAGASGSAAGLTRASPKRPRTRSPTPCESSKQVTILSRCAWAGSSTRCRTCTYDAGRVSAHDHQQRDHHN